jgi:hypothetical protein
MQQLVLVFVHLNSVLPAHLIANIKRTNVLFPEKIVCIVTNVVQELPKEVRAEIIHLSISEYQIDFKNHKLDSRFRNGFWQTSLVRILVLEKVHKRYKDFALLHIESDVLLFDIFPFTSLLQKDSVMWSQFGEDADVGALMYFPTVSDTEFIVSELRKLIKDEPTITDMSALSVLRKRYPERINLLPGNYADPEYKVLPYIFDGAMLGMWLLGEDPRNNYGYRPRFRDRKESHHHFVMGDIQVDLGGRLTLAGPAGVSTIVSLHVHCKDARIFNPDNYLIKKRVAQSNSKIRYPLFSFIVFFLLIFESIRGGSFKGYIYHFPLLGRFLKIFRTFLSRSGLGFRKLRGR